MALLVAGTLVFMMNLPFGFWRSRAKKLSVPWFLAVHLPVPLVILVRIFGGLGWHLVTFPVLIGAYACGQFLGGRLIATNRPREPFQESETEVSTDLR